MRDPGIRLRRVDVHASDDLVLVIEDGVGEPRTSFEVVRVALQVAQVLGEREPTDGGPSTIRKAWSGTDVIDTRCPGAVIGLVVLGSKRLQAEAGTHEALRNHEIIRNERLSHTARIGTDAREAVPDRPGGSQCPWLRRWQSPRLRRTRDNARRRARMAERPARVRKPIALRAQSERD